MAADRRSLLLKAVADDVELLRAQPWRSQTARTGRDHAAIADAKDRRAVRLALHIQLAGDVRIVQKRL